MAPWLLACLVIAAGIMALGGVYVFLVRPWHLRWGATDQEAHGPLPGDDLVSRPKSQATHAVTIGAPAAHVWPWLLQLGQDRGGFYSYTWLENFFGCHMRNTGRIVPEWQHLQAGNGVLFHPKMPHVPVALVEPNRALILGGLLDAGTGIPVDADIWDADTGVATSWAFVLREMGGGRARLIVRLRSCWPRGLGHWLVNRLSGEPAHFIMERKMLLTIKRLAEAAARAAVEGASETAAGRLVHQG